MWNSAKVPSGSVTAAGLWHHTPTAASCFVYGPVIVSDTACVHWLFDCQLVKGHDSTISATNMWYVVPSKMTLPPHDVTFGVMPYPCGNCTGSVISWLHWAPPHGSSQLHCPALHTPFKKQSRSPVHAACVCSAAVSSSTTTTKSVITRQQHAR
jgi:hypothetical protein